MNNNLPQSQTPSKAPSPLALEVLELFSNTFGIALEDLSLDTDLVEDFDIKSDLEGLARFVHTANLKFEVDLKMSALVQDLDALELSRIGDIVTMIEEAQLE